MGDENCHHNNRYEFRLYNHHHAINTTFSKHLTTRLLRNDKQKWQNLPKTKTSISRPFFIFNINWGAKEFGGGIIIAVFLLILIF